MSKRIKRNNDELKADRPTINEVKFIPRLPISILVENVRSVQNVASISAQLTDLEQRKYISADILHIHHVKISIRLPWAQKMPFHGNILKIHWMQQK